MHQNVEKYRNLFVIKLLYQDVPRKGRLNAKKFQDRSQSPYQERSAITLQRQLVSKLQNKFQAKYASPSPRTNARPLHDIFHAKYPNANAELFQEKNVEISQDVFLRRSLEKLTGRNVALK